MRENDINHLLVSRFLYILGVLNLAVAYLFIQLLTYTICHVEDYIVGHGHT